MQALEAVRPEAGQFVGWLTASPAALAPCPGDQREGQGQELSSREKPWSGGASWECPAAPCPWMCPLQAQLLSSVLSLPHNGATCCQLALAHPCPGPESPGTSHCVCSPSSVPSRTLLLLASLTTVSLRCGHLLLGGFPFFIRFDNALFRD